VPIQVGINLNGLRGRLARSLQRTMLLVAAGLQNLDKLDPEFLDLPTDFKLQLDPSLRWTDEQARVNYSEWVLSNGFRDAIESIGSILEETHQVLSIWELCEPGQNRFTLSGSDWNDVIVDGGIKFHRLGLPDKLKHITISHSLFLDEQLLCHLLSINIARNCLVHRNGVVTKRDLTSETELKVTWRKMSLFLKDEDGEKPLQIGEHVEKDSMVCMRFVDVEKSFALGEKIVFSVEEFAEVCWSLFYSGNN